MNMNLTQTICASCITLHADKQRVCSTEVEDLALVFEKSATELKSRLKLLRCKSIVHIVTLIIRISQLPELTASVAERNRDSIHRRTQIL